ncbi:hypothetical protein BDV24DRAFT_171008 [Aspergillus arachidicola]|uniref:Zn(2)-C6 fungal-type domain-containing protein n=1 Tax=Aspergillus arachidicola TaxID=656916 RepID=A0A5N6YHW0_9EURO|nr:hypothetical protein BDV24DRAFT_171008 [Aspergillus arachidicola]
MVRGTSRSQNTSETRARPIKHVTRACTSCRKRKIKCDGAKPQCANCALYNQECTFSVEIDKRSIASKGKISTLVAYVQALESLLLSHHIELPASRPGCILPAVSTIPPSASEAQPMETISQTNSDQVAYLADQAISIPSNESSPDTQDRVSVSVDSFDMGSLSDRMGSLQIAEDGQLRFFGPTSNLHISHVGPFPLLNANIRSVHWNEDHILKAAGVDLYVDEELEEHLTRLYFTWENPNIPLVDEAAYREAKHRYRKLQEITHRYSEVLNNAICAVGAALTPRYCPNLPEALVDFFAARSKALLEVEMDSPALSTVQSLGILSGVEALLTRDARGWLYSGMAMRLATDLGLHIDATPFTERGLMDLEEARLRSQTFWGTYIHERMWSLYVGRPESIDQLDISVQQPSLDYSQYTNIKWFPYIDETQNGASWESPALLDEIAKATVALCSKMASIRKVIYNTRRRDSLDLKSLYKFATKAREELFQWLAEIPPALNVDLAKSDCKVPPHVFQLHMQYHVVRIMIHLPFAYLRPGIDGLAPEDIEQSHETCHVAAWSITKLIQAMRRNFSLRRVNIHIVHLIFTAMLVHVHNAYLSFDCQIRETAHRQLEICSQALGEIGQAYKNALRALEVIMSIKSDLLRRERNSLTSGLSMTGRPGSFNSISTLGRISSSLIFDDMGSSEFWPGTLSNDNLWSSFELMPDVDIA